jgi:predicted methyltransferase
LHVAITRLKQKGDFTMTSTFTTDAAITLNTVLHGDCVEIMRGITSESVDFVLTDQPYVNRYI